MTGSDPVSTPTRQQPNSSRSLSPDLPTDGCVVGDIQRLVALLQQQRDIYQQLQALSRTQSQLVDGASAEPLLAVLAQRQQLVDELARLHSEMEPYRQQWDQVYGGLSGPERDRVASLVTQVEQLLAEIIDQDNRDRHQLEQSKDQVGKELSQVSQAGAAIAAYKVHHSSGIDGRLAPSPLTDRQG